MVRQLQPKVVISPRSGWKAISDCRRRRRADQRPYPRQAVGKKCLTLTSGGWGYVRNPQIMSLKDAIHFLINAAVRKRQPAAQQSARTRTA